MGDEKDETVEQVKDPAPSEEAKADEAERKDESLNPEKGGSSEDHKAA